MPDTIERKFCPKCRIQSKVNHCKSRTCNWTGCNQCNIVFIGSRYFRWIKS